MKIEELREKAGITQGEIANVLGVSQSNYSKYELGTVKPNIDLLTKIADYYGVSLDYLCDRKLTEKLQVRSLDDLDTEILNSLQELNKEQKAKVIGFIYGLIEK